MGLVKEYKCLSCNAGLEFNPTTQNWKCNYCFSEFSKEKLDDAFNEEELLNEEMPQLDSYKCTSCGAELIADSTTSATFCLYCKSPTVIKARFSGKFKPKTVIPFKITQQQAKEIYKNWIGKRRFVPSDFKQKKEIDKVTGIYAPFWLFDCKADGVIDGEATKIRTWTTGEYKYTQTKHYRVMRSGNAQYNKVPVDASIKLDDKFMQLIEPYNYDDLKEFSMQYMSGFMAEKYDVEASIAEVTMKERVESYLGDTLRKTIDGYSNFIVKDKELVLSDTMQDYSMLPIYLLVNKYKEKEHIFIVNGQTGKVVGDTPISFQKQAIFAGAIFTILSVLAVLGGAFFV